MRSRERDSAVLAVAVWLAAAPAGGAAGETSWISGEVKLNLRRGAGTQYKIIGSVSSEDPVTVLGTEDGWYLVRLEGGKEGYIPEGYLSSEPPAALRVEQLETEGETLRARLAEVEKQARRLQSENQSLSADGSEREEKLARLTGENQELRALVRWREWITGASILAIGMVVGAILSRRSGRRRSTRLRV